MTPKWIASRLGPVDLDPCWNRRSPIRCRYYMDIEQGLDGLALPWEIRGVRLVFVNPPYSRPGPWTAKARAWRDRSPENEILLLLKHDPSTLWWRQVSGPGWYVGEFPFRLRFGDVEAPDGVAANVANFPSALVTNVPGMLDRFPECRWMVTAREPTATNPEKTSGNPRC